MDRQELGNVLYYAAATEALALGYRIGHDADNDIRADAANAAASVFARPLNERERDIEGAVRIFRLIVHTMIAVRSEAYRNEPLKLNSNEIGEATLQLAKLRLCPGLFPFC